jgi:hypothetical protein
VSDLAVFLYGVSIGIIVAMLIRLAVVRWWSDDR